MKEKSRELKAGTIDDILKNMAENPKKVKAISSLIKQSLTAYKQKVKGLLRTNLKDIKDYDKLIKEMGWDETDFEKGVKFILKDLLTRLEDKK